MPDQEKTVYGYIGITFTSAHFVEFCSDLVDMLVALGNRRDGD